MASLWQKFSTLVKSKLHGLLDKAIDTDSPEVVKQYIRELEDAVDEMNGAVATAKADLAISRRDIVALEAQIQKTSDGIDKLLTDTDLTNDRFVPDLERQQMDYERDLGIKRTALADMETTATSLEDVAGKLRAKHREMMSQLGRLETLARSASAKEAAGAAIKAAGATASVDAAASVDDVARKIERRSMVADEQLKQAMGQFGDSAADAVAKSEAERRIAERRARLAAQKNGAGPTPATAGATSTAPTGAKPAETV